MGHAARIRPFASGTGETNDLGGGLTLIRCGGHYEGGQVLHWARRGGALLSGDIVQVIPDRRYVSFMYSYPNLIPLAALEGAAHRARRSRRTRSTRSTARGSTA